MSQFDIVAAFGGRDKLPRTPWGPVGYATFKRTYARSLDGDHPERGSEEFHQTIQRVLRACETQLGCGFTPTEQREFAQLLLELKGSVAGRFLWQLGSETVDRYGLLSLQNCAAIVISDPVHCFQWMFDALMLGVGVGYNIEDDRIRNIPPIKYARIEHRNTKDADFIVPDSREGWVKLIGKVMKSHFVDTLERRRDFTYSTILVRPKGSPIKRFGGVASGPDTLIWGIGEINRILNMNSGRRVTAVVLNDIATLIGQVVVSGNVRRSALLTLGSAHNVDYLKAKDWSSGSIPYWRANANNSVHVRHINALPEEFWETYEGKAEPLGMVNLQLCREVGQTSDGAAAKRDPDVIGVNPCVHGTTMVMTDRGPARIDLLSEMMLPQVELGYVKPKYAVVAGTACTIKSVGETNPNAEVVDVITKEGYRLRCTRDHRVRTVDWRSNHKSKCEWVEAQDLKPGTKLPLNMTHLAMPEWPGYYLVNKFSDEEAEFANGYALGWFVGRGTIDVDRSRAYFTICKNGAHQDDCIKWIEAAVMSLGGAPRWIDGGNGAVSMRSDLFGEVVNTLQITDAKHWITPQVEMTSSLFQRGVITGLFDCDGIVSRSDKDNVKNGDVRLVQDNPFCARRLQRMLLSFGVLSGIYHKQMSSFGDHGTHGGYWYLEIRRVHNKRFMELFTPRHDIKLERLRHLVLDHDNDRKDPDRPLYFKATVTEVTDVPNITCSVYDMTVAEASAFGADGLVVHNCGEQPLEDYETCCLAEIFVPNLESEEQLFKITTYLYRVCKHSLRLPCHWKRTENVVHRNMRMGISVTGILEASDEQRSWLPGAAQMLDAFDVGYSQERGFPTSIKLRTVKPSGTLSLLAGVTAGCHPAYSQYYLKRMRVASSNRIVEACRSRGYHIEPLELVEEDGTIAYDRSVVIVDFPVKHADGTVLAENLGAIAHLEWVRWLQQNWSDNAVSVTIYYRRDELPAIQTYLAQHWRRGFKSVSFLLHTGHGFRQAPITPLTRDEYEKRVAAISEPLCDGSLVIPETNDHDLDSSHECAGGYCPVR